MTASKELRVNSLIGTNHALSHFYQLCLAPMFVPLHDAFGASYTELGLLAATMLFFTGALQTPMGVLVDRIGARPFLIGGSLAMAGGMLAMGFATHFWQLLVLSAISGIGNSVIHPADYAILSGSIRKEVIGRSFAVHSFSGNIGYAIAPSLMVAMTGLVGWRGALIGAGLLGLLAVAAIALQSRVLADQTRPARDTAWRTRDLFTSRTLWLFFAFYMLSAMAVSGMQNWLITVLHQVNGFEIAIGSTALTIFLVCNSAGTLLGGWVADHMPRHMLTMSISFTIIPSLLIALAAFIALTPATLFVLLAVAGFTMGASRTPRDVMLKEASPPGQIGKVFGFVSSGLPFGSAITPLPFGWLMDHAHPQLVLPLAGAILLSSVLCIGSARASGPAHVVVAAE